MKSHEQIAQGAYEAYCKHAVTVTPRPGSFAEKAIEHFRAHPDAEESSSALAALIECKPESVSGLMHAEPIHAWAWKSGLIEFGREVPEGALSFATGMDAPLRQLVGVLARHGKGKGEGQLLVPGVPEAATETARLDALIAWVNWCAKRNGKKESSGVVFTNRQDGLR